MASIAEANSLFEIDMELDTLLEEIEVQIESEGEPSEELVARFREFCEARGEKVDRIGRFVRMMEAREQFCRSEAARLGDRARAAANRIERTKNMALYYLLSRDLKKIEGQQFTLRAQKNSQDSVRIIDESALPKCDCRIEARISGAVWETVVSLLPEELAKTLETSIQGNHWANGSLYGNIEFHFDWRDLIEDKKFFWVEAIAYNPHAFRILITDKKQVGDLEPYPVESGKGPLFFDKAAGQWYWNGNLTGEFMLDEDLPLRRATKIGFCGHHPNICRKDASACGDRDLKWNHAGAQLIGKAIAQGVLRSSSQRRRLFLDGDRLDSYSEYCVLDNLHKLRKLPANGNLKAGEEAALPLASAILDRFARGRKLDPLTNLFADSEQLELAMRIRMSKAFGIDLSNLPSTENDL